MRYFLLNVFILTHSILLAQISDDFSDGDFTTNPAWSGTVSDYQVNGASELQLNNSTAAISYLSTPHGLSNLDDREWNLWVRQAFSPSSGNYGRIYLTSSSADLSSNPNGFYLQLGESGSNDAVRLFKCDGGTHTELLAGPTGQIASSFSIRIRVVRSNTGDWTLYIDPSGGTNYAVAGTVNDGTNLLGTHFGVFGEYTMSNATDFYYDDIYVGDEIVDVTPPSVSAVNVMSATQVDVLFDEVLDQTSAELLSNYSIVPTVAISSAALDGTNQALVHLNLVSALANGQSYDLNTENIQDLSGNPSAAESTPFSFLISDTPAKGDVIINEFMCDPSPQVGLPEVEFVELYNRSTKIFNLDDWQLGDASSSGTIQQGWLLPGEYMILTSTSNVDSFAVTTGVSSFPSLNNSGDNIVLRDLNGSIIDSITYTNAWYQNEAKEDGGYTIERINPNDPCTDITDWRASDSNTGGTPGQENSVIDLTPDTDLPKIDQLIALAPNFLEVYFTEGMDSTSLKNAAISTSPSLTIQNNYVLSAHPEMLTLEFVENLSASQVYTIELENIGDCWLNTTNLEGKFALPEIPEKGDVIINEILSNPLTGGGDWVEVYNHSDKLIDLYNWEIANHHNDTINNHRTVDEHFLLFPGEYAVLAEDTLQIIQNYPNYIGGRFIEMDLPTYSNAEGTVYLIAQKINQNEVIDEVRYSEDWHFELIDDAKGKSLERIDFNGPSSDGNNWHTAAESIGFGTPGGENSQYYPAISEGDFNFTSETVSPDSDGFEDVLQINYALTEPGLVGDFTIYDDRGRKIATVLKSELLATSGTFIWDGVRDDKSKASIGMYVAVFEVFSTDGEVKFAKRKAFTVAGRL